MATASTLSDFMRSAFETAMTGPPITCTSRRGFSAIVILAALFNRPTSLLLFSDSLAPNDDCKIAMAF